MTKQNKTYLNQLLDDAEHRANITTDNALSKVLGIHNGWISDFRKDPPKRHPSTEIATKLAILAGRKEMQVIAEIELMTAKTDERRNFWKQYIENRGITATLGCVALGISLVLTPEPAAASILQLRNYDANFLHAEENPNIHYA
jgi:hypothetical protein